MKTRAQIAAAILNNFSTAINATETAYNSAGSAAKENEKVLESLNGHIQAFRSEWESLVNSKTTQDTLKFFIDLATNVVKLAKALGGLSTILPVVISLLTYAKFGGAIKSVAENIYLTYLYSKDLTLASDGLITKFQALGVASTELGTSTTFLLGKIGLIVAAIYLIVKAVDALIVTYDEQKEKTKELADEFDNAANKVAEVEGKISDNQKLIDEINSKPLDIVNKNTLETLKNENAQLRIQKELLEGISDQKKKELAKSTYEQLGKNIKTVDTLNPGTGTGVASAGGVLMQAGTYNDIYQSIQGKSDNINIQHAYQYIEAIRQEREELTKLDLTKEEDRKKQEIINTNLEYYKSELAHIIDELQENKDNLDDSIPKHKKLKDEINELGNEYIRVNSEIKTFDQILKDNLIDEEVDKLKKLALSGELTAQSFKDSYPDLALMFDSIGLSIEDVILHIKRMANEETDAVDSTNQFNSALSTIYGTINEISNKYKDLSNAVTEYNKNGKLSVETMSNLLQKYPDYLAVLETEGYSIEVVNNLLKNEIQLKINEARQENESALQAKFGTDVKYEEAKARVENARAIYEEVKAFQALHGGIYGPDNTEQILKEQEDALATYEKNKKKLDLLEKSLLNGFGSGGSGSSGSKKTTDTWKEAFTKAYNDLKNRRDRDLISTEQYYKELKELNDTYFKDREKYVEEYTKYELELYKGIKEVFKEQIDDMQHAITMLENQGADKEVIIAKYKEIQDKLHEQAEYYRSLNLAGNQDEIDELSEQWWQYQKNIEKLQKEITDELKKNLDEQIDELKKRFEALRDVALDTIEKQIDEKQNWLEEQNNLLDEQIDKYKDQKDTMEDEKEIQEKLLKIEEARKKLAEAKNKRVRVYREGKGFVYETDFDAVNEAQKQLNDLLEDWQLFQEKARIQDIVEQLEAEKQANKDRVNKEIEDLNRLKDAWDKSLDLAQDVENYKNWLTKIENSENDSFNSRLNLVKEFVNSYNAEMKQLQTQYPTEAKTTSSGGSGSGGSGGVVVKKYNGVSYNPNVDYQRLINEAKASNAPADHLVGLEKKRNAKIAGEGITKYSPTYNYTSPSGYASGTERADGLMHVVGENGPELYVPPEGSGILPNNITSNLMNWGTINPMQLVKSLASNSGTVINVDNISLPNVKDGDSFVNELKNFKSFAIQRESNRK